MKITWNVFSPEWGAIERGLLSDLEELRSTLELRSDKPWRDDEIRGKIAYIRTLLASAQELKEQNK